MFDYYYRQAVKKAWSRLLLLSVAAAVLAFVLADRAVPDYQVHYSYLVSLSEREAADEFRFDGYYALSATDLFAATLASWIKTPEVIAGAFRQANITVSDEPRALKRAVEANKTGPQLVEVTVRHKNKNTALLLTGGLQAVMRENIARYHDEGMPAVRFRVVATEPWVGINRVAVGVIVISTWLLVLFGGLNIVLLRASLTREGREESGGDDRSSENASKH